MIILKCTIIHYLLKTNKLLLTKEVMGDQNHTKYTLLSLIVNVLNIYFKGMYCPPGEI